MARLQVAFILLLSASLLAPPASASPRTLEGRYVGILDPSFRCPVTAVAGELAPLDVGSTCIRVQPGENLVRIDDRDQRGWTVTMYIVFYSPHDQLDEIDACSGWTMPIPAGTTEIDVYFGQGAAHCQGANLPTTGTWTATLSHWS